MSLAVYQDAFARMVLSPALCRRARDEGEAAFRGMDLSDTERARLVHIARQRGMQITCVLARANRLSSLVGALPLTCALLQPELNALLDRFWEAHPMPSLQALPAGLSFGRFLQAEIAAGRVSTPHAADLLRFELERLSLQQAAHVGHREAACAKIRRLDFPYDPSVMLEALATGQPVPRELPAEPTTVVLDYTCDPPEVSVLRSGPQATDRASCVSKATAGAPR